MLACDQLLHRMKRCGEPDEWNGHFTCRTPGCASCRGRYIGAQFRDARKRFADADNDDMAFVTIVVGATSDVSEISDIFQKFRKDFRNVVDSNRRQRRGWDGVEFVLWLETDAFSAEDFLLLGPDKRSQLGEMIPIFLNMSGPVWVVTVHGIARLNGLEHQHVRQQLEERWSGHKQVDVARFFGDRSKEQNLRYTINYALKHECRVHLGNVEMEWGKGWAASYYGFLSTWSRGFQSLRISINPKGSKSLPLHQPVATDISADGEIEPLPFTCSYSIFPTY
jgi:hypothetical protein